MSPEDNKAIIRSYVETVWNQRQLDRAEEFVAPDLVDHAPLPGQGPGLDGARRKWAMYLDAAPDLRVTIEDLVAEDDKVGVRRSYAGTHRGNCWAFRPLASRCEWAASASSAWPGGRSPRSGSSWICSP